jgi:RecJ-like exonuclease
LETKREPCSICEGKGRISGHECPICKGKGYIEQIVSDKPVDPMWDKMNLKKEPRF